MNITERILFEDNHIIAVDKMPGELSQGDSSGRISLNELLKNYIKDKYKKPGNVFLGIVHRLDFPVSGAIVYARTSKSASRLSEQIRTRSFTKIYTAISTYSSKNSLSNRWKKIENHLVRNGDKTFVSDGVRKLSKKGVLYYKTLCSNSSYALNIIKLETGRKHQIRCQLSHAGLPIVGDIKYSGETSDTINCIYLHSSLLSFQHPTLKKTVTLTSKLPSYFNTCLEAPSIIKMEDLN